MITAVDSSVLLDVFANDPEFRERSLSALRSSLARGQLVVCDAVWAEVTAAFPRADDASRALSALPVAFSAVDEPAAALAGEAWQIYRAQGGPRERIVSDFMIAAHATLHADQLLTRDRGSHRLAFAGLRIVDPSA